PTLCSAVISRRLCDDFLVPALQHARAGPIDVDVAGGTECRAAILRTAQVFVSWSTRIGLAASVAGDRCLPGGVLRVDSCPLPTHRHGSLSCRGDEAAAAPPAGADRHAAGTHRADRDESDGRSQELGRTAER